jgi:hypothetical protein
MPAQRGKHFGLAGFLANQYFAFCRLDQLPIQQKLYRDWIVQCLGKFNSQRDLVPIDNLLNRATITIDHL